jgi:hypothetical protein
MKKFFTLAIVLCFVCAVSAQVSTDPTDRFYKEAQGWQLKGYIENLPQIRPYPANLIKEILEKVIECGVKRDAETAAYEYERIFGKTKNLYVTGAYEKKFSENLTDKTDKSTKNVKGEGGIAGEVSFNRLVSFGYDFAMYAEVTKYSDIAPYYVNKSEDSIFDPASVGPIDMFLDWNTNLSFGTNEYYAVCGLSKTGYGPFLSDGLALNDSTYHSANLLLNVQRKKWSYASSFEILGASTNNPDAYGDLASGKYLSFHSIKYSFNKYIDVSYYENIIFGPTFNPAYLFPVPYMPVQNIGGANDNLQMGLLFDIKPVAGFGWATDIFVDDFAVNDVVKLNFDSKIRLGGQTGFIYAPSTSACSRLALNYQMVLPYVYAHWEYCTTDSGEIKGSTTNYQNYTNSGINIGSVLDPNSDKVSFSASFSPKPSVRINFNTNFIRHCNSAEAFDSDDAVIYVLVDKNQYLTDGSSSMHQMFSDPDDTAGTHVDQAWNNLGFMTSDHKMGVLQAAVNTELDLPRTKHGMLTLLFGYTFEYVKNAGVNRNVYTGGTINWKDNGDGTYDYDGNTGSKEDLYTYAKTRAAQQKADWVSALTDRVNHYISVGFKYVY